MAKFLATDALTDNGTPVVNLANLGCASPWAWGATTAAATSTAPAPASSIWLVPALTIGFNLSAKAQDVFKGVFAHPPSASFIRFGFAGSGNSGITVEGVVTLDVGSWNADDEAGRIHLLAHEHTHLPQEGALTMAGFLARYAIEYRRADNYVVPAALAAKPVSDLEPLFLDSHFTMDQMAQRVGNEAVRVARSKGYV